MKRHDVVVSEERASCGTISHKNAIIKCSCGWKNVLKHTYHTDPEVIRAILYHRVTVLEEVAGIKITTEYKLGG